MDESLQKGSDDMMGQFVRLCCCGSVGFLLFCAPPTPADSQTTLAAHEQNISPQNTQPLRFAVIGDYGYASPEAQKGKHKPGKIVDPQAEADVAAMVLESHPDFVLTTGDNNYPVGAAETLDDNVGQFYHSLLSPYHGRFGGGADQQRFFPALGNHDWANGNIEPYLRYFKLPNNGRYYDIRFGPVHVFVVDSDPHEPDGREEDSTQAAWIKARMLASDAPWKVVTMHHPPYSSSKKGGTSAMHWPFAKWGAHVVLAGHHHAYERLHRHGIVYITNGLGGAPLSKFGKPAEGSKVQYNADFGFLLATADEQRLQFTCVNRQGVLIDAWSVDRKGHTF